VRGKPARSALECGGPPPLSGSRSCFALLSRDFAQFCEDFFSRSHGEHRGGTAGILIPVSLCLRERFSFRFRLAASSRSRRRMRHHRSTVKRGDNVCEGSPREALWSAAAPRRFRGHARALHCYPAISHSSARIFSHGATENTEEELPEFSSLCLSVSVRDFPFDLVWLRLHGAKRIFSQSGSRPFCTEKRCRAEEAPFQSGGGPRALQSASRPALERASNISRPT